MERSVEQALRACGSAVPASAIGLLDEVRSRLFGTTPRRARLGRYEILARIGAGGGGVVLRAFDPRLQRDVAIKVVHAHGGEAAQVRLFREARALARISHPNVVALFDVGRVDLARDGELARFVGNAVDGSVYLVMEWLDGGDLAAWLAARPRRWPEIVRAFVAAGRGLEAAHAAGVLHRDFKPQNVVLGRDGARADACLRVADFGLTRPRDPSSESIADDPNHPFGITRDDTVMGTPIYMAPEQHVGGTIDERTDQYAFCTALHEALTGPRSFESLTALVAAKMAGLPPVATPGVPPVIVRAIARGMQRDPARRFPSMTALLAVLDGARPRPLRRIVAIGAGVVAVAALAAGRPDAPPLCSADDPGWAGVWTERRDEIATAWSERAGDLGRTSFGTVDERVSALGQDWSAARERACAATAIETSASCLEDRRRRAAALVEAWSDASIDGIAAAVPSLQTLDDPSACLDARPHDVPPRDREIADAVAQIDAFVATGRVAEASRVADELEPRLARASDADVISARFAAGIARDRAGDYAGAERDLVDAVHRAEAHDDAAMVVRAAAGLVTILGAHLGRTDEGERWRRHAWAALERVDADDGTLRAVAHAHSGQFAMARGDWRDALEHYTANLALVTELHDDDDLLRASATAEVAGPLTQLGRHDEAIALYEEAIALQRNQLGDEHPSVAMTRHNLANPLGMSGRLDRARTEVTAALDTWMAAFGDHHPHVALALHTLGIICNRAGDPATAAMHLERAYALRLELFGPEHRDTLATQINLAVALERLQRYDDALALLERVAEVYARDDRPVPNRGILHLNLGGLQRRVGALADARASLLRALELLRAEFGPSHIAVGMALLNLGMTERDLGDGAAAIRSFDDAEAMLSAKAGPHDLKVALVHLERGRLAAREGRRADAEDDYARGLAVLERAEHADAERAELAAAIAELDERVGARR